MRKHLALLLAIGCVAQEVNADDSAPKFPIKTKAAAIEVGKRVCLKFGPKLSDEDGNETPIRDQMSTLKWEASLQNGHWYVTTAPSVYAGTNTHWLDVDIPMKGPEPHECSDSLYTILGLPPRKPKDCTNVEPSDISALNASNLAFEAYNRGGWVGGIMGLKPESDGDAWIVSIRVAAPPGDNTSKELAHYKVFKRTANVVDTLTGEEFNSLPSKAHYLELHCLAQPQTK